MSAENKAVVRRFFEECVNDHAIALLEELMSPDIQSTFAPPGSGRDGFATGMEELFTAFPDLHVRLEDMLAEGDRVATRGTVTGTHRGELRGVPPTGKRVEFGYIDIWRIENGVIVENWVQMDIFGLLQQLEAIPAPA